MFASFADELRHEKKEVSQLDTIQLMPDESHIKDVKVSPKKDDIREYNPSTYSDSEGVNNVPATLAYLDDYLDKIKNNEKPVEQKREKVENFFQDMISRNELCMQVPANEYIIMNIISNHFKNGFETRTNLCLYNIERKEADALSFGIPTDVFDNMINDHEEFKLEKYGYLGAKSSINTPSVFGDAKFIFKKEESRLDRTTMTVGDSLDNAYYGVIASRLTDPKVESIPGVTDGDYTLLGEIYNLIDNNDITPDMDPMDIAQEIQYRVDDYKDVADVPYFELQYHGDLKMKDVESCELPASTDQEIKDAIKGAGVPVVER